MSLITVWDELWTLLADVDADDDPVTDAPPVAALTKVRRVYRGEPFKGNELAGIWVAMTPGSADSDYWNFWLRVYSQVGERPIETQLDIGLTVDQIETLLDGQQRFERSDWEIGPVENLGDWTAFTQLSGPRE